MAESLEIPLSDIDKMLRWFEHASKRPTEASVRRENHMKDSPIPIARDPERQKNYKPNY